MPGQHQVEDDEIVRGLTLPLQRRLAVIGLDDLVLVARK